MKINLKYDIENIVFARKVLKAIRETEEQFFKIFQVKEKNFSCDFTIFSTREEYKKWTGYGERYKNWMVGKCDGKNIAIIHPKNANRSEKDMLEVSCHEFAHLLLEGYFKVKNKTLDEGFACFVAGQMPTANLENPPKCEVLEKDFAENGGYDFSPIYVKYILEKFGAEEFVNLLKNKKFYKKLPKNFEALAVDDYKKTNQID